MGLISNRIKYLGLSGDTDIFLALVLIFRSLRISRYPWEPSSHILQTPWLSLPISASFCAPCCPALQQGTICRLTACFPSLCLCPAPLLPPFISHSRAKAKLYLTKLSGSLLHGRKLWEKPSDWTLHRIAPEALSQVPLGHGGSTHSPAQSRSALCLPAHSSWEAGPCPKTLPSE